MRNIDELKAARAAERRELQSREAGIRADKNLSADGRAASLKAARAATQKALNVLDAEMRAATESTRASLAVAAFGPPSGYGTDAASRMVSYRLAQVIASQAMTAEARADMIDVAGYVNDSELVAAVAAGAYSAKSPDVVTLEAAGRFNPAVKDFVEFEKSTGTMRSSARKLADHLAEELGAEATPGPAQAFASMIRNPR